MHGGTLLPGNREMYVKLYNLKIFKIFTLAKIIVFWQLLDLHKAGKKNFDF
jgi:hypothetical protein